MVKTISLQLKPDYMKLNRFTAVLTLLFAFASLQATAQIEIKNKIVDFGTLMPIESASIYVKGTTIGVVSNSDGKFVLEYYKQYGFIPADKEGESVSRTLEYAYDDFSLAQVAQKIGKEDDNIP